MKQTITNEEIESITNAYLRAGGLNMKMDYKRWLIQETAKLVAGKKDKEFEDFKQRAYGYHDDWRRLIYEKRVVEIKLEEKEKLLIKNHDENRAVC